MKKYIDITKEPRQEQIDMLLKAQATPIPDDAEYPEFTDEELSMFKRISDEKKFGRQKQTITLRISQNALQKAKSLGKGYTSVLSRILENALDNTEIIKKYL